MSTWFKLNRQAAEETFFKKSHFTIHQNRLRHPERSEGSPCTGTEQQPEIPHYVRDDE